MDKKVYFLVLIIQIEKNIDRMEALSGTLVFWFISVGLVVGALTKVLIWNKGVKLVTNLVGGVLGAVVVGVISVYLEFPGSLIFALVGSISILFILNVFHAQSEPSHH